MTSKLLQNHLLQCDNSSQSVGCMAALIHARQISGIMTDWASGLDR